MTNVLNKCLHDEKVWCYLQLAEFAGELYECYETVTSASALIWFPFLRYITDDFRLNHFWRACVITWASSSLIASLDTVSILKQLLYGAWTMGLVLNRIHMDMKM